MILWVQRCVEEEISRGSVTRDAFRAILLRERLRSVSWTGPGPKVRYKGKKGSIVVVKEEEEERYCFGS